MGHGGGFKGSKGLLWVSSKSAVCLVDLGQARAFGAENWHVEAQELRA